MIQDLHSHTRYSNCGRDEPALVVEAAIQGGIELLGISDHNYGIGDRRRGILRSWTRFGRAMPEKYASCAALKSRRSRRIS